ncbi:DUF1203 domain-containing protein [Actinoplanes aureus]|uniref:DUF1203 domain-containing protein n=1 Tax=Actinoplanes aureus TaxID=2792083 RepID=A0A931C9B5_9ACTN|nr:DUF1203 domain-containing protein [Actinoplanes aureus]MBG0565824.1 DUF1203 domain-containing protein [Actinoplanes aureus]
MTGYRIDAIPGEVLREVRERGLDVSGNPVERVTAGGGEPLRCCLRDAGAGEELILFGYEPPLPAAGPYREVGAVFAHREACAGPVGRGYPAGWHGRAQVFRAYDERGWIHPASTVDDGTDPEGTIRGILADPSVRLVHTRNVTYGCFMLAIVPEH